jgi:hypothetical protein
VIEWFLTSVLIAMSRMHGMSLSGGKSLASMIGLTTRESRKNTIRISAVCETRKTMMNTVPVPVVSELRAVHPSTFEMIDTLSEVAAENVRCLRADELTKADHLLDLALMTKIPLTVTTVLTRIEELTEVAAMIPILEVVAVEEPVIHMTVSPMIWMRSTSPISVRGLQTVDHTRIQRALIEVAKEVRDYAPLVRSFSHRCWTSFE